MKKGLCHLLIVLTMLVWPAIGNALPDEKGEFTKLGVGNLECGLWAQARQSGDVYAVWWKTLILGWVQGFLTAYNLYGPGTFDITGETDAGSVAVWVDSYCVQHPRNIIAGAAEALIADLQKPHKGQLPGSSIAPR